MAALATLFVFFVELWDAIKKPQYRSLLFVLAIILLLGMVSTGKLKAGVGRSQHLREYRHDAGQRTTGNQREAAGETR